MNESILSKWTQKAQQSSTPISATLELTHNCNQKCSHCYLPSTDLPQESTEKTMTVAQWEDLLIDLKNSGTLYLTIMGGEPMVSPRFWQILKMSKELAFHTSIITNGLQIQKIKDAKRLKEIGIDNITFSLYSLTPKIHEQMTRTPGSFRKTIRAIKLCQRENIPIGINTLLTKDNIDTISELQLWCSEREIPIKLDPAITPKFDGDKAPIKLSPSKEQLTKYYNNMIQANQQQDLSFNPRASDASVCNAANTKCAITPQGQLLPCVEIRESLGDLTQQPFMRLWKGDLAKKWRALRMENITNIEQELLTYCDHCFGESIHLHNDPLHACQHNKDLASVKKELLEPTRKYNAQPAN